jgi:ArsR family transcriptional regulator, virulence genes transcriptional regulator
MLAVSDLQKKAEEVAGLLGVMSNPRRLLILCKLAEAGEMNVTSLVEAVGLSQSALSQHLALMRACGLVATRKEGLNVYYRIADPRAFELMQALERVFCRDGA